MAATKMVFQIWKTSVLEDFQITSRKSSRGLPESLLTESSPMSPFHNRSECFGFSDLDLDMQVFQIQKTSVLEDFQITSRKSSRGLPESLLTESSPMSPFHNRSECFGNCSSSPAVAAVLLWRPPGLTFSFSFSSESLLLVLIVVSPFVFYGCLRRGDDPDPVQIQSLLALGETLTGKEILFASLRIG
ncbi:hypothetical protein F2Q68_00001734 [Brassica cretica]|uniref:Uncharacterized protein n=1 Tax=Brassica cretica TaxID=69181 RepID=A0A8S9JB56_BRACR|nr:hypothetical protein F2Q68_00001734 [Brassica cretica]